MKIRNLIKVCDRCERRFEIPDIKKSSARNLIIEFTPCTHCLYVKDVLYPINNKSGRCIGCSIPFSLVDHHAKGRCSRCSRKHYRERDKKTAV